MNTDLIAAAHAAHAETLAAQAQDTAAESTRREEEESDFLRSAAEHTAKVLGPAAANLSWLYTPKSETPEHIFAATASLAPLRAHEAHLAFTFDAYNGSAVLAVVRICRSCTHQLNDEIDSLAALGRVLDDARPHGQDDSDEDHNQDAAPGPLAAIEAWETRAAGISKLARRLIAEHPDAGLTVSHIVCTGHDDGSGSTEVNFTAASTDAVRQVAAALDAEVTTRHSGSPSPYGVVLEHADARGRLGLAVDVTVRGYTQLPDDEAAAWRAQQDQATEAGDA